MFCHYLPHQNGPSCNRTSVVQTLECPVRSIQIDGERRCRCLMPRCPPFRMESPKNRFQAIRNAKRIRQCRSKLALFRVPPFPDSARQVLANAVNCGLKALKWRTLERKMRFLPRTYLNRPG